MKKKNQKNIRYFFEWLAIAPIYYFVSILPIEIASNILGNFAAYLGPKLKLAGRARKNLEKALPELTFTEKERILKEVFRNLGNVFGEFPHLAKLRGKKFAERVAMEGKENFKGLKKVGRPVIVFSGHFANWEILPKAAYEFDHPLSLVYRRANNSLVDKMIMRGRRNSFLEIFDKGRGAARGIYRIAKNNGFIGMLVDQKMNDGIKLKFFGRDAMTSSALAELALKFNAIVLPAYVERLPNVNFCVRVLPPMEILKTGDDEKDKRKIMQDINDQLEKWVREKPEHWFWLHNRWID